MNQQETASNVSDLRLSGCYTASSGKPLLAAYQPRGEQFSSTLWWKAEIRQPIFGRKK
jgi:hypothetical protein